jgi:hypothetical protein
VVICIYNVEQINEIENIFTFQNKPPLVLPDNARERKREYKKTDDNGIMTTLRHFTLLLTA